MSSDWVTLGIVRRAHGVRGDVVVDAFGVQAERFEIARRVFLSDDAGRSREAEVERARDHGGQVVVKLGGVDDRSAAEALRNWELRVPISERLPLGADEFYNSDLLGCDVVGVGVVQDVVDYGAGPLLIVDDHGKELMIPFVKGIWKEVDLAAKRIVVELPEGLRD